jgi:hypothetical protein
MAQDRWICISKTIQIKKSNEFASQRYAIMVPYILNLKENNRLVRSDLSVVLIAVPPLLISIHPISSFNLGQK